MAQSMITSVRLPSPLRQKLERMAEKFHRGKNWIIIEALERYFDNMDNQLLKKEARRQSLLASRHVSQEDIVWENNSDLGE